MVFIVFIVFIVFMKPIQPIQPIQSIQPIQQIQDSRYNMAPEPLRSDQRFINIPTRGIPDSFQSIGIVTIDEKILPLYGRRITSDKWNYYTRTDTYNPVPIPIHYKRRDCMEDIGCQEIYTGDEIKVEAMNKTGRVNIYKFNAPKYISGLI